MQTSAALMRDRTDSHSFRWLRWVQGSRSHCELVTRLPVSKPLRQAVRNHALVADGFVRASPSGSHLCSLCGFDQMVRKRLRIKNPFCRVSSTRCLAIACSSRTSFLWAGFLILLFELKGTGRKRSDTTLAMSISYPSLAAQIRVPLNDAHSS